MNSLLTTSLVKRKKIINGLNYKTFNYANWNLRDKFRFTKHFKQVKYRKSVDKSIRKSYNDLKTIQKLVKDIVWD